MAMLVELDSATVTVADRTIFDAVSLTVDSGQRVGVVGLNGAGKSTLLAALAGELPLDGGLRRVGRGTTIHHVTQHPNLGTGTVRDAVGDSWTASAALDRLSVAHLANAEVATLSGGQTKRVALARAAANPVDLLILDEPTNHLDLLGVVWLEQWLTTTPASVVLVSHDRYLLDALTTVMVEVDRGALHRHAGGYASYLESVESRAAHDASVEATRRNLARRELAWLRRGAKARSRKPKARIDAAYDLLDGGPRAAARSGELQLEVTMPRLGDQVFELDGVDVTVGDGRDVLRGVDLLLGPGDRVAIVGANGAGKSTLLDLLAGHRAATKGSVTVGSTVVVGYYDQHGEELEASATVREVVAGPYRTPGSPEDRRLMEQFWFDGSLQYTEVRDLSGGERRRLQLLAVLATKPNVLLLDEPTNDLDLETLRVLEAFLDGWAGTLVVVSHDRAFLERMADTVLAIDDRGCLAEVPGGLDAWMRRSLEPSATPRTPPTTASSTVAASPSAPSSTTSTTNTSKERRALEKEMARLERACAKVNEEILATTDFVEARRLGDHLRALRDELAVAEDRWLELATS